MSTFDQAARHGGKLEGEGFFAWMLRRLGQAAGFGFARWEDARRLAVIPGLERIDDVVAVLRRGEEEVYLIVEMETEPRRHVFKRLGIYQLLLSIEVSPGPGPEEVPAVAVAVLTLTGRRERQSLQLGLPGLPQATRVEPLVVNLCDCDATVTLEEIARGETARCILVWVPLMAGGGERAVVERWKELAMAEPDEEKRAAYGALALVFAELTPGLVNWQQGLEGWEMRESQLLQQFLDMGELRGIRASLLDVIAVRLANPVPEQFRLAIEGTNDPDILRRWLRLALTATSLETLQAGMSQGNGAKTSK